MPVLVVCVLATGRLLANAAMVVPRNQLAAEQALGVDMSQ